MSAADATRGTGRRRAGAAAFALLAAAGVVALALVLWPASSNGPASYRVDAIFDVARGIGPQQVVKIAGAQVGTVTAVRLTRDDKARIEMSIDPRFAPFRADAACKIAAEGLISENFVQCSPGSAAAPPLGTDGGPAPTVPVAHDTEPVSLQDLFNIWSVPVSERLTVLLDELGIGVSGRAGDIQAVLDRANPGLAAARRAIALVNTQRAQLQQIVTAADPVIGALARHDTSVRAFIDSTAALTSVTATHRAGLEQTIARLPALLRSARPALQALDSVAAAAPPLLDDLRSAAPSLDRLGQLLPPVAGQAASTLVAVSPALTRTRSALAAATPTLGRLAGFAADADPAGMGLDQLLVSLRDGGVIESLMRGLYNGAALTSHYDADSHIVFADMLETACLAYARTPTPGCNAHTNGTVGPPATLSANRRHASAHRTAVARRHAATPRTAAAPTRATGPNRITVPGLGPVNVPAAPGQSSPGTLQRLLNFLL